MPSIISGVTIYIRRRYPGHRGR